MLAASVLVFVSLAEGAAALREEVCKGLSIKTVRKRVKRIRESPSFIQLRLAPVECVEKLLRKSWYPGTAGLFALYVLLVACTMHSNGPPIRAQRNSRSKSVGASRQCHARLWLEADANFVHNSKHFEVPMRVGVPRRS
jgi:hypothetical protein